MAPPNERTNWALGSGDADGMQFLATEQFVDTRDGVVLGTFNYMAPEHSRGTDIDLRADLFALGVLLYEMLAGQPPFKGATGADDLAMLAAVRGEWQSAFHWLTEACVQRSPFLGYVEVEPAMAPLFDDSACRAILRQHGFRAGE